MSRKPGLNKSEKNEKKCERAVSHFPADLKPYNHAEIGPGRQVSEKMRSLSARVFLKTPSHFLTLLQTSRKPP